MSEQKKLVINADDYGISVAITDGITYGLSKGFITDVSMMVVGSAAEYALGKLQLLNRKYVGLHATFVDSERPFSNFPQELLEGESFCRNRNSFLLKALRSPRLARNSVKVEVIHQLEWLMDHGLKVSHLDSHQHLHIFPIFHDVFVELAEKYKIKFVRVPYSDQVGAVRPFVNMFSRVLSRRFSDQQSKSVRFLGFRASGNFNETNAKEYLKEIQSSSETSFELMVHPGFEDEETKERYSYWNFNWKQELDTLEKLNFPERIRLASFQEIL